jgi:hypothetical protein
MDPTENIEEQERILAQKFLSEDDKERLEDLREAYAHWIMMGGFPAQISRFSFC